MCSRVGGSIPSKLEVDITILKRVMRLCRPLIGPVPLLQRTCFNSLLRLLEYRKCFSQAAREARIGALLTKAQRAEADVVRVRILFSLESFII